MNDKLIWGFMLYLSDHMWADESSKPGWYFSTAYNDNISTEINTWDDVVKFLGERKYNLVLIDVGDGIKYESHPEISAPNAWDKDFLKKKLSEMRALGIEPIPKLNFSTCHDTWMKEYRRMVSTPTYYAVCADLIKEVCEVFDYPRLFHLGFDEERADMQGGLEMSTVRGTGLWWHDLYYLCGECEKYGARPWVWSDYIWKNEELFLKNMPKSVLQSNWYYQPFKDWSTTKYYYRSREFEVYEILDKHGYDQIPTGSTWICRQNSHQTVAHGKEKLAPEHLLGFLTAPWLRTTSEDVYGLFNDAHRLFVARQKLYPETLE